MVSLKTSRRNRQIRAVVNAIKALALHQAETVLVATISRCADDLAERNTAQASRLSPEELALFAAYKAATLAPSRRLIQAAPGITAEETADLCARLQNAAERASPPDRVVAPFWTASRPWMPRLIPIRPESFVNGSRSFSPSAMAVDWNQPLPNADV